MRLGAGLDWTGASAFLPFDTLCPFLYTALLTDRSVGTQKEGCFPMKEIDKSTRNRILLVLFVGVLMAALDIAIVGPALPAIRRTFGVDERAVAWIFTIYVLTNLIGTPLMAKLSDAWGRRWVYVGDVLLFALGSLIVALSPSFAVLLAGRAVQGLGAGGIFPVASAVIGDTFPPERRGSALGLIGAVFGIAFLVGPVLAGVFLLFLGWHWLFLVNIPIAAVVIAMSLRLLPATRPETRLPFDWPGMVVLGIMLGGLAYGINQLDTEHLAESLSRPDVWGPLVAAIVSLPVFVLLERRAVDPIVRLRLFRSRQAVLAYGLSLGAGLGEAAVVFVPELLVAAFGVSTSAASFMLLPAVLAMAVGAPMFGRMLDRMGSRRVVLIATLLLTVGLLMVGKVPITLVSFYTVAILVGLGLSGLLGATLRYIMLNEAPLEDRAAAQGVLTLFTSTGQLLGGAAMGALAASRGGGLVGYRFAFMVVGVITFLLWLSGFALKSREEELRTAMAAES